MTDLRLGRFSGFLLISGILIVATVVVAGLLVGVFFEDHVFSHEAEQVSELVRSQAVQHLTPGLFENPGPAGPPMFQIFLNGLPGIFRVKAFDPAGRIVWSNESKLIGMAFADNPDFRRASGGEVVTSIIPPTSPEHIYESTRRYIAEVYVPVTFPGSARIIGVIEVYKDLGGVMARLRRTQQRIWAITGAMGIVLYISLAVVVRKASANELRAIRRLEARNRELVLLQDFARSVLHPLDLDQVTAAVVESAGARLGLARARIYRVTSTGELVLLAAWPAEARDESVPVEVIERVIATRQQVIRGVDVVVPCVTPTGLTHVFVGGAALPLRPDSATVRTLEIMLHEAVAALTNVELFSEIRQAHERLTAILTGIADRMVMVDREMRIVWMNAVAAEACGSGTEGLGDACFEALGMGPEPCGNCPATRTFLSGRVERGSRTTRSVDGRAVSWDLVTAPLRDPSGEVVQVLEVARDVTDLVEMEQRLKEVNRTLQDTQAELVEKERLAAVGELVVSLHHAILNPLTGILGALSVLQAETMTQSEKEGALADAEAEIRKIERLIRQLPDLREAKGVPYVGKTTMLDLERI